MREIVALALAVAIGDFLAPDAIAQARNTATAASRPSSAAPHDATASVDALSEEAVGRATGFADFDETAKPYAYIASAAIWRWPQGAPKVVYVCWENPDRRWEADQDLVRQAVAETWQRHSQLHFEGWQRCAPNNGGIRIRINDSGPHTKGLGRGLDGVPDGMVLNFTFDKWNLGCKASDAIRRDCIYSITVHEFGHALGYAHEQNRFDTPGECRLRRQGSDGDLLLTPYDPKSVMNYCNERYNNEGRLSERDRTALAQVYGAPL